MVSFSIWSKAELPGLADELNVGMKEKNEVEVNCKVLGLRNWKGGVTK